MDTREKILDAALTLFSQRGYEGTSVEEIAELVGIKAPSLYKHYKSKEAIFNEIYDAMNRRFAEEAARLKIYGTDPMADVEVYKNISEEQLISIGKNLFLFFLHDDYNKRFRKMLTIEQFRWRRLADVYMKQYVDDPLNHQIMLFYLMGSSGFLREEDVNIMALHFYAPIYMLMTVCDRRPDREAEALKTLEAHIRQFNRIYGKKEEVNKNE